MGAGFKQFRPNPADAVTITGAPRNSSAPPAPKPAVAVTPPRVDLSGTAQPVPNQKFKSHALASVTSTLNAPRGESQFHVSPLVAEHMGLGAKEEAKREKEIQLEIDRRWIDAKEKAEVEGYTAGLNVGKREAYAAEKPRIEEKLKRLDALLQGIDNQRTQMFTVNEEFLMRLMAQLFRVIALRELETDKEYLRRLVLNLIQQLGDAGEITLTVGEIDVANIQKLREAVEAKFTDLKSLKILTNTELPPAACKLETKTVVIDASLDQQIRNAMQVLYDQKETVNKDS